MERVIQDTRPSVIELRQIWESRATKKEEEDKRRRRKKSIHLSTETVETFLTRQIKRKESLQQIQKIFSPEIEESLISTKVEESPVNVKFVGSPQIPSKGIEKKLKDKSDKDISNKKEDISPFVSNKVSISEKNSSCSEKKISLESLKGTSTPNLTRSRKVDGIKFNSDEKIQTRKKGEKFGGSVREIGNRRISTLSAVKLWEQRIKIQAAESASKIRGSITPSSSPISSYFSSSSSSSEYNDEKEDKYDVEKNYQPLKNIKESEKKKGVLHSVVSEEVQNILHNSSEEVLLDVEEIVEEIVVSKEEEEEEEGIKNLHSSIEIINIEEFTNEKEKGKCSIIENSQKDKKGEKEIGEKEDKKEEKEEEKVIKQEKKNKITTKDNLTTDTSNNIINEVLNNKNDIKKKVKKKKEKEKSISKYESTIKQQKEKTKQNSPKRKTKQKNKRHSVVRDKRKKDITKSNKYRNREERSKSISTSKSSPLCNLNRSQPNDPRKIKSSKKVVGLSRSLHVKSPSSKRKKHRHNGKRSSLRNSNNINNSPSNNINNSPSNKKKKKKNNNKKENKKENKNKKKKKNTKSEIHKLQKKEMKVFMVETVEMVEVIEVEKVEVIEVEAILKEVKQRAKEVSNVLFPEENQIIEESSSLDFNGYIKSLKDGNIPTVIDLNYADIGDEEISQLTSFLGDGNTVTSLVLDGNNITCEGAIHLANFIQQNKNLISLSLSNNLLGGEGTKRLCSAIINHEKLAYLRLSGNRIDVVGAKAIANVLIHNTTLSDINLHNNTLLCEGVEALAKGISVNVSLVCINLSHNHIKNKGIQSIGEALTTNSTVRYLILNRNMINTEGIYGLAKGICNNETLTSLEIKQSEIPPKGIIELAKAFKINKSLCEIDISLNNIDIDAELSLYDILKSKPDLDITWKVSQESYWGEVEIQTIIEHFGIENVVKTLLNGNDYDPIITNEKIMSGLIIKEKVLSEHVFNFLINACIKEQSDKVERAVDIIVRMIRTLSCEEHDINAKPEDLPIFIKCCFDTLEQLKNIFDEPLKKIIESGKYIQFHTFRLKLLELFVALIDSSFNSINKKQIELKIMHSVLDILFYYPQQNIIHFLVDAFITTWLATEKELFAKEMFMEYDLLSKIMKVLYVELPKKQTERIGNVGMMIEICNNLCDHEEHYGDIPILKEHVEKNVKWQSFINNELKKENEYRTWTFLPPKRPPTLGFCNVLKQPGSVILGNDERKFDI